MDSVKKGQPITADWANGIVNAISSMGGADVARSGGGQNVGISPYQRGVRPLAFDLVKIKSDGDESLSGEISGGVIFFTSKEEKGEDDEKEVSLNQGEKEIKKLEAEFKGGDKVWVEVDYNQETWIVTEATLKNGKKVPEPSPGKAYFTVGEFEEKNEAIIYKHKGVTCIQWDLIKWEFEKYKLTCDTKCALELTKTDKGEEITLNIESLETDAESDSLRAYLVYSSKEEGSKIELGVRLEDNTLPYQASDPISIVEKAVSLKLDTDSYSTKNGIKYKLGIGENGVLCMSLEADTIVFPDAISYDGEAPIKVSGNTIALDVDVMSKTSNGIVYGLTTNEGTLRINLDASSHNPNSVLRTLAPINLTGDDKDIITLDYEREWSEPSNGIKVRFKKVGMNLALELNADSMQAGIDLSDNWTSLACNTDYALRPQFNSSGFLYIQQGQFSPYSNTYEPIN